MRLDGLSRRGLLQAMAGGAIAARSAAAEEKVSQAEARYQDRPKGGFSCAACALFRPPHACVVVAGDISPDGWCRFFDLPD
ncbi:MAG: hypothetical protein ACREFH_10285 [Stellaceae bacterium]